MNLDLPLVRMLWALVTGEMTAGLVETVRQVLLAATCGAGSAVLCGLVALLAASWDSVSAGAAAPESELLAMALLAATCDGVSAGAAAPDGGAAALTSEGPAGTTLGPMGKVVVSSSLKKVRVPGSIGVVDMSAKGKDDSSNTTWRETIILLEWRSRHR
jgi:hypothetical protein